MRLSIRFALLLAPLACLTASSRGALAQSGCDLKITRITTCDASGNPYQPVLGDATYFVRVDWAVTGTPAKSYGVEFQIANQTWTRNNMPVSSGTFWEYGGLSMPLDGEIPYSVTLDPGNVAGDTNRVNNVASGTFQPTPPQGLLEYYDPQILNGSHEAFVTFLADGATVTDFSVWLGAPTSNSFQAVVTAPTPAGASVVSTTPHDQPIYVRGWGPFKVLPFSNYAMGISQNFTVMNFNVMPNRDALRSEPWSVPTDPLVTQWLEPSATVQSSDPHIAAFVAANLPANYRQAIGPYDAARALFLAVARTLTYAEPPGTDGTALGTLLARKGDCSGYSLLFVACLRNIGIPARELCGWWVGGDCHCIMEFYLPGPGWVQADPTTCSGLDSTGTYSYAFGYLPYTNQICFVSVGDEFTYGGHTIGELQVGAFWFGGPAQAKTWANSVSLTVN
jgi:transglutaminase-like putative cysteine protease